MPEVGRGRDVGTVGTGVARAAVADVGAGVARGVGGATGDSGGRVVGDGDGVARGVGRDAGRLKVSSPGMVCGDVPFAARTAEGVAGLQRQTRTSPIPRANLPCRGRP